MAYIRIGKSLLWGIILKLSCMYKTFAPDMYTWTTISSLRKVINTIIWIWFLSIQLGTQCLWDGITFSKSTQKNTLFAIYTKYISGKYYCQIYILVYNWWYIIGVRSSTSLESVLNTKTTALELFSRNYSTFQQCVDICNSVNAIQISSLPRYHTSYILVKF
jgi:hypothetical protein